MKQQDPAAISEERPIELVAVERPIELLATVRTTVKPPETNSDINVF
jgi:hypothetical protein